MPSNTIEAQFRQGIAAFGSHNCVNNQDIAIRQAMKTIQVSSDFPSYLVAVAILTGVLFLWVLLRLVVHVGARGGMAASTSALAGSAPASRSINPEFLPNPVAEKAHSTPLETSLNRSLGVLGAKRGLSTCKWTRAAIKDGDVLKAWTCNVCTELAYSSTGKAPIHCKRGLAPRAL